MASSSGTMARSSSMSGSLGPSSCRTSSAGLHSLATAGLNGDGCLHSLAPAGLDGAAQLHPCGASGESASRGHPYEVVLAGPTTVGSSELKDLAAVLADSAESRLALQAAASACEAAEVCTSADLALAGSGNVLPQDIRNLILGGCVVPGSNQALEDLFVASRNGLEGNLALMSRRLASGGGCLASATLGVACTGTPGSRAERRIASAVSGTRVLQAKWPRKGTEEVDPSLRAKESARLKAALDRCFDLLQKLGDKSPRFQRVAGAREAGTKGAVRLQENAFIGNFSSYRSLDGARRKFEAYLVFFTGLRLDPFSPSEWDLAAWISDQAEKGASGPRRALQALAWAEKAFELDLRISAPLVQAQRSSGQAVDRAKPKPAKMATIQMLTDMEKLVFDAPSVLLRCWAGAFTALGHGVLRWSDLQHSEEIALTTDAVFGTTWKMKGKKVQTPWAALRIGFSGRDWGKGWLTALALAGLPGADFTLRAPNHDWTDFQERIADFHDAQAALRVLLVTSGLDLKLAMSFTCHSWRHLYPTAGNQLDLTPENIDSMGRWQPGGGMSDLYDSRACVSELLQKSKVVSAVASGWRLVDPGCVPVKLPPSSTRPARPSRRLRDRAPVVPQMAVLFVMNTKKAKLHGYAGGVYTMCRQWRCGDRGCPTLDAEFVTMTQTDLPDFETCRSCAIQHKCVFPSVASSSTAAGCSTRTPASPSPLSSSSSGSSSSRSSA